MTTRRRYDREGLLALDPRAIMMLLPEDPPDRSNIVRGDVEVVRVVGALEHHASRECDSYDGILERFGVAIEGPASTIVLSIDSPGGLVAGCFEAARALRARARAAGKRLVAYVGGSACSAAYALACAADQVVAAPASVVGHIGIIDARVDATASDAQMGLRFAFVTSGARKADGNPHLAMSTAEHIEKQGLVDALAGVFFALVADMRGVDAKPLEARVFVGEAAKTAGLVDEIKSFDDLLASLAGAEANMSAPKSKYEEARAALAELAEGEGDEADKAKKALAAMDDSEEEPAAEGEGTEEEEEEEEPAAAAAAGAPGAAATVSASTAGAIAAENNALAARLDRLERSAEASERATLLASRTDLTPGLRKLFQTKPLAEVRAILSEMKPPKAPSRAAAATVAGTRGEGQGAGTATRLAPEAKAALDIRMGLVSSKPGVKNTEHKLTLGAPVSSAGDPGGKVA